MAVLEWFGRINKYKRQSEKCENERVTYNEQNMYKCKYGVNLAQLGNSTPSLAHH